MLAVCSAMAGCQQPNTYVEPPPPEVTVAVPACRDVTDYIEATGTAQPYLSVDIRARVKGFLKERRFKEGSMVKENQLLLVIDEEPFRVQVDQAKTRLAEAEAALVKAKQSRARGGAGPIGAGRIAARTWPGSPRCASRT